MRNQLGVKKVWGTTKRKQRHSVKSHHVEVGLPVETLSKFKDLITSNRSIVIGTDGLLQNDPNCTSTPFLRLAKNSEEMIVWVWPNSPAKVTKALIDEDKNGEVAVICGKNLRWSQKSLVITCGLMYLDFCVAFKPKNLSLMLLLNSSRKVITSCCNWQKRAFYFKYWSVFIMWRQKYR